MLTFDIRGIVHATGTGDCTWYELASAIVSAMGRQTPVHPITTAEAGRRAARPRYSVLANCVLKQSGITLPHWRDSLAQFVEERGSIRSRVVFRGDHKACVEYPYHKTYSGRPHGRSCPCPSASECGTLETSGVWPAGNHVFEFLSEALSLPRVRVLFLACRRHCALPGLREINPVDSNPDRPTAAWVCRLGVVYSPFCN